MWSRRTLLILAALIVLLIAGHELRDYFGIELSAQGLRSRVAALGAYGPIIFVGLVWFRTFLFLPSALILSAGGLVFGVLGGTLLGWLGLALSAALLFGIGRAIRSGRTVTTRDFGPIARRISGGGALVIAAVTAHPFGPLSPVHTAAGFSAMTATRFFSAVVPAAPMRAFGYSFFGMTLADIGSREFYVATIVLTLLIVVPLSHRGLRRRILQPG